MASEETVSIERRSFVLMLFDEKCIRFVVINGSWDGLFGCC